MISWIWNQIHGTSQEPETTAPKLKTHTLERGSPHHTPGMPIIAISKKPHAATIIKF